MAGRRVERVTLATQVVAKWQVLASLQGGVADLVRLIVLPDRGDRCWARQHGEPRSCRFSARSAADSSGVPLDANSETPMRVLTLSQASMLRPSRTRGDERVNWHAVRIEATGMPMRFECASVPRMPLGHAIASASRTQPIRLRPSFRCRRGCRPAVRVEVQSWARSTVRAVRRGASRIVARGPRHGMLAGHGTSGGRVRRVRTAPNFRCFGTASGRTRLGICEAEGSTSTGVA